LLYSRFSTDSDIRYSISLFLFPIIGTILCIYKWVVVDYRTKRQRFFNKEENFVAREFFNGWDYRTKRLNDAKHNKTGVQNMLKVMIYEDIKRELVKNRSGADKLKIYTIRACLMFLSIILLIIGWIIIIVGSLYEQDINNYAKDIFIIKYASTYSTAIILTVINYVVPKCLGWITECEKWDFAIDQLKNEIWRNYLAQMLNLAIFVFVQVELVLNDPLIRDETIIDFSEANEDSTVYDCREDYFGLSIFKLFILELIQRYIYYFGWVVYYKVKARCQGLNNWRKEFETTDEVVWLLYFQAIIWISFLFFPYLAIVAPIVMYLHFKFIIYRLRNWKISPQMVTNQMTSGGYIMIFLNVTFIACAFLFGLFLIVEIPHSNWVSSTSTLCGPFVTDSKASTPVSDEINNYSLLKQLLEATIAHPIMLVIFIIYGCFFANDYDRQSKMYKKYIKDKEHDNSSTIDDLKIERGSLNKKLAFLRRQDNLNQL
jgi:hypothetical protein